MKQILIIVTLAFFASCNKDKKTTTDTQNPYKISILGKWKFDEKYNNYNWSEQIDNYWTLEFTSNKVFQRDEDSNFFEMYYNIYDNIIYMGEDEQMTNGFLKFKIRDITPYELFIFQEEMSGGIILDTVNYRLIK